MQWKVGIQTMKTKNNKNEKSQLTEEVSTPWSALAEHEKGIAIPFETSYGCTDSINQG